MSISVEVVVTLGAGCIDPFFASFGFETEIIKAKLHRQSLYIV